MLTMVIEAAPASLRGELTRWLTQVSSTVFVDTVSAEVRQGLWELATAKNEGGQVVMAWTCQGEPGYGIRTHGKKAPVLIDFEGLSFPVIRDAAWRQAAERFKLAVEQELPND